MISVISDHYGQLPSVVARELMDDPEGLGIECVRLSEYARAYNAFKYAKHADDLKPWKGSASMRAVQQNALDLHVRRVKAAAAERARKAQEASGAFGDPYPLGLGGHGAPAAGTELKG